MIELAQHIEHLLLENDCVIVPGLGGFVAHYVSAVRIEDENLFLPPTRIIGFNPRLKMNDGLIVQSYMSVYGTNFSDATKMVERKVDELIATLHEDGIAELPNVGEVYCSINGVLSFAPYDDKLTTPYLYGFDAFEMKNLSAIRKAKTQNIIPHPATTAQPSVDPAKRKIFTPNRKIAARIKLSGAYLANAAAVIAAVIVSFFFSTPIKNTEVVKDNYAKLISGEMFEKMERQSIAITPIIVKQNNSPKQKRQVKPISAKEVKVAKKSDVTASKGVKPEAEVNAPKGDVSANESTVPKTSPVSAVNASTTTNTSISNASVAPNIYHIIIASVGTEKDAKAMAAQLLDKGFADAKAIIGDGKNRVGIESHATEVKAYQALARVRENEAYKNAWVLKKK